MRLSSAQPGQKLRRDEQAFPEAGVVAAGPGVQPDVQMRPLRLFQQSRAAGPREGTSDRRD